MDKTLFATFSATAAAQTGGEAIWLQLLPAGRFASRDGRGPFVTGSRDEMEAIVAASRRYAGNTDIMVDYDHQSVFGAKDGTGGRAPAAGWIKELQVRDDGIYGRVEWTEAAAAAIRAGEYRYISPFFRHAKKSGRVMLIVNAGLTNTPALDLAEIAASIDLTFSTEEDNTMDKIIAALGLAKGSGEDACLSAINSLLAHTTAMHEAAGAKKDTKPADVVTLVASGAAAMSTLASLKKDAGVADDADAAAIMSALSGKAGAGGTVDPTKYVSMDAYKQLSADFAALRAEISGDKAEDAVEAAMSAGKITPAQKDWALGYAKSDPDGFEAFATAQPVITKPQLGDRHRAQSETATTDESDKAVMTALGISQDDFVAARKLEA